MTPLPACASSSRTVSCADDGLLRPSCTAYLQILAERKKFCCELPCEGTTKHTQSTKKLSCFACVWVPILVAGEGRAVNRFGFLCIDNSRGGYGVIMKIGCLALFSMLLAVGDPVGAQSPARIPPDAQTPPAAGDLTGKSPTPPEIIRAFSAKETEFYEAWMQYTYHQDADVRVLSVNGLPKHEEMNTISDIVFKDDGTRDIKVVRRAGGLQSVVYTMQDEEVINNLQPFALTEKALAEYDLTYAGKEKVDELTCYVFSVKPRSMKSGKMYFEGKIWVDDGDLQIVRTVGKPVPQKKDNQFPEFETIRQMVDNKYWFPVWTHAESELHFRTDTVHIDETITYGDYKRFSSNATIQYGPKKH